MDWIRFLDENNIHYVTRGPNTKRGEVSIKCPMCGNSDPSEHLGINLKTGFWGCHRDASHRGKSARTLVRQVLGCSSRQAWVIQDTYSKADPDTLDALLMVLEADQTGQAKAGARELVEKNHRQKLDPEFNDFHKIKSRGVTRRFYEYILQRGFDDPQKVVEDYDLRCATTGRYKDRVIIPVSQNEELFGWTARAIGPVKEAPRYLASSEQVKATVFNYDKIKEGGRRLFIVEGPFDAINIDHKPVHLPPYCALSRATCTFGTTPTISQIALLRALVKNFDETFVLFDHGADGPASELCSWLNVKQAHLPDGYDDPGELTSMHVREMCEPHFSGHFATTQAWGGKFAWRNP